MSDTMLPFEDQCKYLNALNRHPDTICVDGSDTCSVSKNDNPDEPYESICKEPATGWNFNAHPNFEIWLNSACDAHSNELGILLAEALIPRGIQSIETNGTAAIFYDRYGKVIR